MRVIGGTARGTKLYTLEGDNTRPTLDRIRESFFNIIQMDVKDSIFLDLFSGSGAIGIEAASRGAKKVVVCDSSKEAIRIIQNNIEKTRFENRIKEYNMTSEKLLKMEFEEKFDYIYIDPPYRNIKLIEESLIEILNRNLLSGEGKIIIETDQEDDIKNIILKLDIELYRQKKYGRVSLIFLEKKV